MSINLQHELDVQGPRVIQSGGSSENAALMTSVSREALDSASEIQRLRASRIMARSIGSFLILMLIIGFVGCAELNQRVLRQATIASLGNQGIVQVNQRDDLKLKPWQRMWVRPAPPSERTALLLRRFNLESVYQTRPDDVIRWFHELVQNRPTMEEVHALAELAEKQAAWSYKMGDDQRATRLYATAIIHAYHFLFADGLDLSRNAYDPQFRSICDVYNRSLEGLLRDLIARKGLAQGFETIVGVEDQGIKLEIKIEGRWRAQSFERFELVNDFDTEGFKNNHRTYGLGVPLIAVRKQQTVNDPSENYYPPELSMPMTAFLHLNPEALHQQHHDPANESSSPARSHLPRTAVLSLYDPLEQTLVKTKEKVVPLESDITTPLAYGLRDPLINKGVLATASLLSADFAPEFYGMYMLEPYDPQKIPVVMVHGIWSSPPTWAHMFNDLRANPDLHKNYQFWFYSYPTAQPFWMSAKTLRQDLRRIRQELDPNKTNPALDQMVFVGHSMGGLVSTMQTLDSQDHLWNVVSDQPIDSFEGDPATLKEIRDTFQFQPNPGITRVITIATPFRGSDFANSATQWIAQKLITLPTLITNDFQKIAKRNSDRIADPSFLTTTTSVDSLSPDNPAFAAFEKMSQRSGVKMHNIVGQLEKRSLFGNSSSESGEGSDGVVEVSSARLKNVASQIFVDAEHQTVHQHPACILEVSRILIQNLEEQERIRPRPLPEILSDASETITR